MSIAKRRLRRKFVCRYQYYNDNNELCFEKWRFRTADGGKTFMQFSVPEPLRVGETGEAEPGVLPKYRGLMYRQPDVRDALFFDRPIYVCEGEKDVNRAIAAFGVEAQCFTSSPNGSTPINDRQAKLFNAPASRSPVRFVMDRDQLGAYVAFANALAINTLGVPARRIRFFYPKVKADKADLFDHIEAGYSLDDLVPVPAEKVSKIFQAVQRMPPSQRIGSDGWKIDGEDVDYVQLCVDWAARVRSE